MTSREIKVEDNAIIVRVAPEFVEHLREWSEPVQVKLQETPGVGTGWDLIFRVANVESE